MYYIICTYLGLFHRSEGDGFLFVGVAYRAGAVCVCMCVSANEINGNYTIFLSDQYTQGTHGKYVITYRNTLGVHM